MRNISLCDERACEHKNYISDIHCRLEEAWMIWPVLTRLKLLGFLFFSFTCPKNHSFIDMWPFVKQCDLLKMKRVHVNYSFASFFHPMTQSLSYILLLKKTLKIVIIQVYDVVSLECVYSIDSFVWIGLLKHWVTHILSLMWKHTWQNVIFHCSCKSTFQAHVFKTSANTKDSHVWSAIYMGVLQETPPEDTTQDTQHWSCLYLSARSKHGSGRRFAFPGETENKIQASREWFSNLCLVHVCHKVLS